MSSFFVVLNYYYNSTKEKPAYGGVYIEGVVGQPTFINPLITNINDIDLDLIEVIFSSLLDLLDNYKISPDNKIWTIFLKKDLKWDDGQDLTAEDVIFTIKTIQDPDTRSPLFLSWQGIEVEKISDIEIKFELKQPYAFFLDNIRNLKVVPKHIFGNIPTTNLKLSQYNLEPIGSNPYKFDINSAQTEKDGFINQITLVPNPLFHGNKPFISKFVFKFYRNESDLIKDFNLKKVSGFGSLNAQNISEIRIKHALFNLNLPRYYAIFMNSNSQPLLQEKEVRRALNLATDKNKIIKKVFDNYALAADGPIPANVDGYNKTIYQNNGFSLQQAHQILEKAGWLTNPEDSFRYKTINKKRQRLEFEIIVPEIPFLIETVDLIKEDWTKLGVKLNTTILNVKDINKELLKTRNYQMLVFGNILNNNPDILAFWHSSERFYPGLNLSLYNNKEVDKLLEDIRKEINSDIQKTHISKLQTIINEDAPAIFLFNPNYIYVSTDDLLNFDLSFIITPAHRFKNVNLWHLKTKREFAN